MKVICHLFTGAVLLHGCAGIQRSPTPPRHTIFVVDATASIVPGSLAQAVKSVEAAVDQIERGDCIKVLPIVSSSAAIPSDEIIRGCAPTQRQAYDEDLKAFRDRLKSSIDQQARKLTQTRAVKTDILGTLDLVDEELALDTAGVRRRVVVFSDFIEEDDTRNFIRSSELSGIAVASTLARDLAYCKDAAGQKATAWAGVPVLLAGLQSLDLARLPEQRREAIRQFWMEYFAARKADSTYVNDGPGMCGKFLTQ